MPSPGGQPTRIADHANNASKAEQAACDIPSTSLQGYHAAPREQRETYTPSSLVSSRAAPGVVWAGPHRPTGWHTSHQRASSPRCAAPDRSAAGPAHPGVVGQRRPMETYRDRDSGLWRRWGGAQARRSILLTEGQVEHVVNLAVAVVRRRVASSWS